MSILLVRQNWADKLSMKYALLTKVHSSQTLYEQRMKNLPKPRRTLSIQDWEYDLARWRSHLKGIVNGSFSVPLLQERFAASESGSLLGRSSITAVEDIKHFWNLQSLASTVALINWEKFEAEELTIDSKVGNVITFTTPITKDWTSGECDFFPLMTATVEQLEIDEINDFLMEIQASFKEI